MVALDPVVRFVEEHSVHMNLSSTSPIKSSLILNVLFSISYVQCLIANALCPMLSAYCLLLNA